MTTVWPPLTERAAAAPGMRAEDTPGKARSCNKKMYLREENVLAVIKNVFLAQVNLHHDKPRVLGTRMGLLGV